MAALIEFHKAKNQGVHLTGYTAARDVHFTMVNIDCLVSLSKNSDEMLTYLGTLQFSDCHHHTSAEFLGMISHLSINDHIQPMWVASVGAAMYMADAGTNIWDELHHFEQTCCLHKMSEWPYLIDKY